ncbi:MAG TPA: YdiU family protein [Bacteroidales bacterium]|nr:YdiU family protein [Bacteroidales bacterium]
MTSNIIHKWQFDNSYLTLPPVFYSFQKPTMVNAPQMVLFNTTLAKSLGLEFLESQLDQTTLELAGNLTPEGAQPIAQAYSGHQYGYFTMLGDGRAILLGEQITPTGERFDIQLKGSGRTPYSRRGDGKATLRAMLREYLISEAMFYLNIPTSRSLAVVASKDEVWREEIHQGAVLTRVMKSHIRIGTFEFARHYGTLQDLEKLTNYVIQRHYPDVQNSENPPLELLKSVARKQMELMVDWMRVGFIHGVMNTDNTSISGETFDYGPCAFMNHYHPRTVYSSIDKHGRYAFQNQPAIIFWNLSVLGDALQPLIHKDVSKSEVMIKELFHTLQEEYYDKWYRMMYKKIGIVSPRKEDNSLIDNLMQWMYDHKADYTNTFSALLNPDQFPTHPIQSESGQSWVAQWKTRINDQEGGFEAANRLMETQNPFYIPRNHIVEQVLDQAVKGDMNDFDFLIQLLKNPYQLQEVDNQYLFGIEDFRTEYKTYCGT